MRVEAPRLSEQPVLPSFPTVTSLPSKDKERPPHLSGDAEGKGPPMKKRKRFSLAWLALLALAGGVELLIVDGTLSGGAPLSRMASSVRENRPISSGVSVRARGLNMAIEEGLMSAAGLNKP